MNCIRKHLLLLAGVKLAQRIAPATSVSLILSDVVGDDLQTIASGPTCPDSTTYAQALSIVEYYGIGGMLPKPVMDILRDGHAGKLPETPKPGAAEFSFTSNILVGTNLLALKSAADEARRLGYHPLILTSHIAGEAREVARVLAAVAKDITASGLPCARPLCILTGGETTVTLRGEGKGGRNQEMALAFLWEMEKDPALLRGTHFLSFSTDGEDGPTDAAGGFALASMGEAARAAHLSIPNALRANDSYTLLKRIDGLFVTGPSNTNVCDIQIVLAV
jgi:hydroxypyruvate reductase